jgi:5-(carboxyamino)imidazole ribonucleotide mutase
MSSAKTVAPSAGPGARSRSQAAAAGASPSQAGRKPAPLVGIIMGSQSDWATMQRAAAILEELGVPHEARIVSAHRTPDRLFSYAREAHRRGLKVIIAGAGGAAHLPGMTAALTTLPVLGVPMQSRALSGQDSLLSIVQMPAGIPVGTLAIGEAGAINAGLLAAQILGLSDHALLARIEAWRARQTAAIAETPQVSAAQLSAHETITT